MIRNLQSFRATNSVFKQMFDTINPASSFGIYSLRKLRRGYTGPCIRIKRSSDSVSQDFYFKKYEVDFAAISTFIGAGIGYVTIWYDQSPQSNELVSSSGFEPIINLANKSVQFVSGTAGLDAPNLLTTYTSEITSSDFTVYAVSRRETTSSTTAKQRIVSGSSSTDQDFVNGIYILKDEPGNAYDTVLNKESFTSRNVKALCLGTEYRFSTGQIGVNGDTNFAGGEIFEVILFTPEISTVNSTTLESNINRYYNIVNDNNSFPYTFPFTF